MAPTLRRARNRRLSPETVRELSGTLELDALFRRYNPVLSRLCVRWTRGHRADAQDLLAEAYLRAVRAAGQSNLLPESLIAWLSAVIANLARDQLRARGRGTRLLHEDKLETLCSPHDDSDTLLATRELLTQTLSHIRRLCPTQRGALLARSAGEGYEAIAVQLGTSPANARKLVQTARHALRAQLSAQEMSLIAGKRPRASASGGRALANPTRR
jgi:RNA polymerase sigma factor (sigma-70 family)